MRNLPLVDELLTQEAVPVRDRLSVRIYLQRIAVKCETPHTDAAALAKHFEKQERNRAEPWRDYLTKLELQDSASTEVPVESLRKQFKDLAEAGELSRDECMIGMYLLYGGTKDITFFGRLMLRASGLERVKAHNFYVAKTIGEAFLSQYGERLLTFPDPLFPWTEEFITLNRSLLRSAVEGAGPHEPKRRFFKEKRPTAEAAPSYELSLPGPHGGAPFLPVVPGPNGTHVVDMAYVQETFTQIYDAFSELKKRIEGVEQQASQGKFSNVQRGLSGVRQAVLHLSDIMYRTRRSGYPPPHPRMPRRRKNKDKPQGQAKGGDAESTDPENF